MGVSDEEEKEYALEDISLGFTMHRLRVIDISNPNSPEIVGGLNYSNFGILCLTIEDNLVYLSYCRAEGIKIIDIFVQNNKRS